MDAVYTPKIHARHVPSHGGAMTEHLGLILHVEDADGSPFNYFNNTHNLASSTWWVGKSGEIEEYVPSTLQAWAQAAGNATYNSVETEGYPNESFTVFQLAGLAYLYREGIAKFRWSAHLANHPGERGFGYHAMGGSAWGGHLQCPGTLRQNERMTIIHMATRTITQPLGHRLQEEVRRFKVHHGLSDDSIIGPKVRQLLGLQ